MALSLSAKVPEKLSPPILGMGCYLSVLAETEPILEVVEG
jgi:hypothetical protein